MNKTRTGALLFAAMIGVMTSFSAMAATPPRPENVMKVLKSNKDFSKFADMVSAAGLESEFTDKESKMTVFAPTNAAMDKLPSDVLKRAKDQKDGMKSLVNYHVVKGSVVFETNIKGRRAGPSTANGEMIGFDGTGKELKVNQAVITLTDQSALNGVVHGINAVLIPESLKDPKEKEALKLKEEGLMKEQMEAREAEVAKEMKKKEGAVPKPAAAPAPAGDKASAVKEAPAAPSVASPAKTDAAPAPAAPAPKEEKKGFFKKLLGG